MMGYGLMLVVMSFVVVSFFSPLVFVFCVRLLLGTGADGW